MLSVEGVTKTFGGLVALDNVAISIDKGTTLLIGPNGSGKTTLINVITGIYKPDNGRVTFNGQSIQGWSPHQVYRAGLVRTFQIPLPFLNLTVLENTLTAHRGNPGESFVRAPLRSAWVKKEKEIVELAFDLLQLLQLDHLWNEPASKLSGGQMKLLEIARALMSGAKMIMMDEPIAGVNPVLAHQIMSHTLELRDTLGGIFMSVEHRLDIALQYVDYVYAMDKGRVVSQGTPEHVMSDPKVIESYLGG